LLRPIPGYIAQKPVDAIRLSPEAFAVWIFQEFSPGLDEAHSVAFNF
jgi:hypothetical protein